MEHRDQPNEISGDGTVTGYEPPLVEDLDTSHGPLVTPAGITTVTNTTSQSAAPREI